MPKIMNIGCELVGGYRRLTGRHLLRHMIVLRLFFSALPLLPGIRKLIPRFRNP